MKIGFLSRRQFDPSNLRLIRYRSAELRSKPSVKESAFWVPCDLLRISLFAFH